MGKLNALLPATLVFFPVTSFATSVTSPYQDFTTHWSGLICLVLFFSAYCLVVLEEFLHLRKSKPVMVAAGLIWGIVALVYSQHGDTHTAEQAVRHNLLEFAELFLFLLAAMTYINTMDERGVFNMMRIWLVSQGFTLRTIFWATGIVAFFLSPIADNLTTALLMATVAMAVAKDNGKFLGLACINIVVAANAGGAFSPFGDITTLMVWQRGIVEFHEFFSIFLPSVVNWLVPAILMSFAVPADKPDPIIGQAELKHGAWMIVGLFLLTIVMAVSFHNFLHLPPVMGMMTGLGLLKFYGYYLKRRASFPPTQDEGDLGGRALKLEGARDQRQRMPQDKQFNIFKSLERVEWDTLMFFYGIILCVGGLGTLGYLSLLSHLMYDGLGPTGANILVGLLSAFIDNIPVMFAVLSMAPEMSHGHWLMVTLTAGVGGSLLSVGSAAGVAVMGQARGIYTFLSHLKWSWAIALGYAASIWTHFLINASTFQ